MLAVRQLTTLRSSIPTIDHTTMNKTPMTMDDIIAGIDIQMTDLEEQLFYQTGMKESPFAGMDKSGRGVCIKHYQGMCPYGQTCPLRHLVGEKMVVCKHWLRGLCKKGDQCEFLHEYDLTKMPECFFFSKYMACSNRECPFRHIDPETKLKDCPWYDRGFCRHGPYCKHRHRRRVMCPKYLVGFCPDGPDCKFAHPSFGLPGPENPLTNNKKIFGQQIVCHNCHERGHKATNCPNLPNHRSSDINPLNRGPIDISMIPDKKVLSEVTCYKCGEKGHYANRCHKGVLAFLSNTAHLAQEQRERDEKEGRRMAKKKKVGRPKTEDREVEDESPLPKRSTRKEVADLEPRKRGRKSKFDMKPEPPPPRKPCNIDFSKGYTIPLKGLQSAITCGLCKGFLVDASTIVECLHTFCKSCLLKHFDDDDQNNCPTCNILVHQSHPTSYISHDRTLQDIIYKLVPGLYDNEVREREAAVRRVKIENGDDLEAEERIKAEKLAELEADRTNRCYEGRAKYSHHRNEPQMVIELFPGVTDLPNPPKRFIRTGEMCTVTTLKRYLSYAMYGTKARHHELDLYFKNELMGRDFSMKFIQVTRCKNKPPDMPLRLNYRHRKEQL